MLEGLLVSACTMPCQGVCIKPFRGVSVECDAGGAPGDCAQSAIKECAQNTSLEELQVCVCESRVPLKYGYRAPRWGVRAERHATGAPGQCVQNAMPE
eukprot:1161833-Pelagomonas_calceolata.AAC.25